MGIESTLVYRTIAKYDAYEFYKTKGNSYLETEMKNFLDNISISYKQNDRSILYGKELDFYISEYNMAIEMNGVYYHSDIIRPDPRYHYNKWKACYDKNIHLVSIFEDDWNNHNIKIKNMLLSFFNKKTKGVPARKSVIQQINGKIARPFLNKYHLQGYVSGKHYGAFDDENNLIGIMTFDYTRNQRFELKRFVTDFFTHQGLFSKLFAYAQKDLKFSEVVSFSDNTCFTGNVYKVNGFKFVKVIKHDYHYLIKGRKVHKSNLRKDNIKKKYPHIATMIDNGLSEKEAIEYLNIPKIWDCGKCEWVWKI